MSALGKLSATVRAQVMRSIRSKHTRPELVVRHLLWSLGARYRLHADDLPGKPDIVLRRRRLAILVHGCFWHLHEGCRLARMPKSRPEYWPAKLSRNKERDKHNLEALERLGWSTLVVWECETADTQALRARLERMLERG